MPFASALLCALMLKSLRVQDSSSTWGLHLGVWLSPAGLVAWGVLFLQTTDPDVGVVGPVAWLHRHIPFTGFSSACTATQLPLQPGTNPKSSPAH